MTVCDPCCCRHGPHPSRTLTLRLRASLYALAINTRCRYTGSANPILAFCGFTLDSPNLATSSEYPLPPALEPLIVISF